ncbi:MAG TPA: tetratricopeptide repeat protein, partial [Chloroflexota bacterium]
MGEREAYGQAMRDGHVHAWAGRWREAAGSYRRALEALPGDLTARSSLAAAYANGGAPAEALELLEKLGAEQPNDSAVVLRLAELRQRAGRQDLADEAYLRVADLYQASGLEQKAIGIWRRLLGLSGHRATTMRRVAEAAGRAGAAEVAEQADALARSLESAAAPAPPPPDAVAAPEGTPAGSIAAIAAALRARGLAGQPARAPARTLRPAEADGPRAALDDALAALQADPDSAAASRAVGLAQLALGEREVGREQLARALDVAEIEGDVELAVALIADLLPLSDEPADLHRRQIRVALIGGAAEAAAEAHLALADWLAEHGEAPAALTEARQARAVAPISARLQAGAARRLAGLGAAVEADDARRRAFQLAPREPSYALDYVASTARRGALEELTIALDAVESLWTAAGSDQATPSEAPSRP